MKRTSRDAELISYWRDGWAARGHISREALQDIVRAWMEDDRTIGPVRHCWWRFIPSNDNDEGLIGYYADAVPGSRGAFRVTHCPPKEAAE